MTPEIQKALEELFRLRFSEDDAAATAQAVADLFKLTGVAVVPVKEIEDIATRLDRNFERFFASQLRDLIRAAQGGE